MPTGPAKNFTPNTESYSFPSSNTKKPIIEQYVRIVTVLE